MPYVQVVNGYIFTIMNCVAMNPKKWIYSMVLKISLYKKPKKDLILGLYGLNHRFYSFYLTDWGLSSQLNWHLVFKN